MGQGRTQIVVRNMALAVWLFFFVLWGQAQSREMPNPVSGFWQFIGVAVEDPGYHVWGSSPIYDDSGKVHVFAARWPDSISFDRGWRTHSEIAHYVAGSPEGPFTFKDLVLAPTGKNSWDKMGMHNPNIQKVKDQYVLTYISNDGLEHHPANQRIGMVLSASLYGPWRKVGKDGMILEPPSNPGYWNYNPGNGVNNPAFLAHPNGGFFLYFKSQKNGVSTMGLAIAENVEGPYVQLPVPITKNKTVIEDGYAFHYKDRFYLMTTDNHGIIEEGGGLLWSSRDGINFDAPVQTFRPIKNYLPTKQIPKGATFHYGGMVGKFERPQLLIDENGCPEYLYVPSGTNLYGGKGTVSYVLKRSNTIKPKN